MNIENILPADIEKKSMEIIESEIGDTSHLSESEKLVVKRVIHTTADFDYLHNLKFSENAVQIGLNALKNGAVIVTDTHMAESGISKPAIKYLGCEVHCFMSDSDIADKAKRDGTTRAVASMDKAAEMFSDRNVIFAIGNAPTSLIRLNELILNKKINPALVIGVPVGFVNVIASKQLIMKSGTAYIVAEGRKGGSNVAAAICNSLLYQLYDRKQKNA
jgi:precorrin-8X/cobalt-precorrin-8 methylmutase